MKYYNLSVLRFALCLGILVGISYQSYAQKDKLRTSIRQIAVAAKGKVGVAFSVLEDGDTLSVDGHARYVLHSVAKVPIAMAVLDRVDKGELSLAQTIHITRDDLPETYSPLRDKYPEGNVDVSIADLLSYMVSLSDNDACDILLKVLGGTQVVEDYMHHLGIKDISIQASEQQMASAWKVQYTNWCYPTEMVKLFAVINKGSALSKSSNDYLLKIMLVTSTGPKRIKGLLPAGTPVAHKTGTGPTNKQGMTGALNDAGIITLPNGKHLALAVFLTDTYAGQAMLEQVIARISKVVYDYAVSKSN